MELSLPGGGLEPPHPYEH